MIEQINASSTHADAIELIRWSKAMIGKIERGDMMIGIVSVDQARMIPIALRKALDIGVAEAGICLADWFVRTPIGEVDIPGAEEVLLEVIALGMDDACMQLMTYRWFYRRDSCTDQEAQQAFSLLEKWCARNPKDSQALYLLALVTCHGFGTSADAGQSADMLESAVSLGNADAMFELYIYYANGIGVAVDESKAIEYLRRAGEAGQVRAMYNLGAFHATGRHVPQDEALAVDWYTRAANAGHYKAAETLATMYENGLGVAPSKSLAQRFREMLE
jgi:uncharacterized protein